MALVSVDKLSAQFQGFSNLPGLRQMGLLVGLATSVAVGLAVVLWSQEPNYGLLYTGMSQADAAQAVEALEAAEIPYRLERGSSAILVPSARVREARLELATLGLPKSSVTGLEFLDQEQTLGTSRMIETARYHRALAGELSRTISTLDSVESSRVHLAIPKRSVFLRDRAKPSASVLVNLYPGRKLGDSQLAGIVHLVASSIPELEAEQVTVVDQRGRLLTSDGLAGGIGAGNAQLRYRQRLEQTYNERITEILAPIVGREAVRAQVSAEIDFTAKEQTTEDYDPESTSVRSEQLQEQENVGPGPLGVPGALTNQPPETGTLDAGAEGRADAELPRSSSRRSTRNYEVDRRISHSRRAPGRLERLSVAVVVDYRMEENAEGAVQRVPLDQQEMEYITALVREAVGYSADRGDSVNVINASFRGIPETAIDALPVWKEPWFADVVKQVLGGLVLLFLLLGVLRPTMKSLAVQQVPEDSAEEDQTEGGEGDQALLDGAVGEDQLVLSAEGAAALSPYEQNIEQARSLIQEDPRLVAQVVKTWIGSEE